MLFIVLVLFDLALWELLACSESSPKHKVLELGRKLAHCVQARWMLSLTGLLLLLLLLAAACCWCVPACPARLLFYRELLWVYSAI